MIRNLFLTFVVFMFSYSAYSQTHMPSLVVDENIVTIDADIIALDGAIDISTIELLEGTVLSAPSVFASSDGVSPIVLKMPVGVHSISAWGFPEDRMFPERNYIVLSATINAPTREQLIVSAYKELLKIRAEWNSMIVSINELNPTKQETRDALVKIASGQ